MRQSARNTTTEEPDISDPDGKDEIANRRNMQQNARRKYIKNNDKDEDSCDIKIFEPKNKKKIDSGVKTTSS